VSGKRRKKKQAPSAPAPTPSYRAPPAVDVVPEPTAPEPEGLEPELLRAVAQEWARDTAADDDVEPEVWTVSTLTRPRREHGTVRVTWRSVHNVDDGTVNTVPVIEGRECPDGSFTHPLTGERCFLEGKVEP
jgi:hypothetical protein